MLHSWQRLGRGALEIVPPEQVRVWQRLGRGESESQPGEPFRVIRYASELEAVQSLRQEFAGDPVDMAALRRLVHRLGNRELAKLSDDEVIVEVARSLLGHRLQLIRWAQDFGAGRPGAAPPVEAAIEEQAPRRPVRESAPQPAAEPSTLPEDLNSGAMASTLTTASENGAATCEVCERAAAARGT